jgi:ubiquinone/menaquinone biosynthesis C-methylase UbiE
MSAREYVLGQSERAARRLELQDRHFAAASEALLDALELTAADRVAELGCGPGGLTKRLARRVGTVVAVDASESLLAQARTALAGAPNVTFVRADVSHLGEWLTGADVVLGRAILHHVPMAEFALGRLKAQLPPGTRIGFLEPDFRRPLAELARQAEARPQLSPLLTFARCINELYAAWRISPAVGASLPGALADAGFADVRAAWHPFATDADVLENMSLIYDEVRDTCAALGIISAAEQDEQKRLLAALVPGDLPAVWGLHCVTARA